MIGFAIKNNIYDFVLARKCNLAFFDNICLIIVLKYLVDFSNVFRQTDRKKFIMAAEAEYKAKKELYPTLEHRLKCCVASTELQASNLFRKATRFAPNARALPRLLPLADELLLDLALRCCYQTNLTRKKRS